VKVFADFVVGGNLSFALGNILEILGNLFGIIGGLHQFGLVVEYIGIDIRLLLIYLATLVNDLPPNVIYKDGGHIKFAIFFAGVAGLGIKHDDIVDTAVNLIHWSLPRFI
jgi:hypothetical protein